MNVKYPNKVIVSDKYEGLYTNIYDNMEEACKRYTEVVAKVKKDISQGKIGSLPITVQLVTVHSSIELS